MMVVLVWLLITVGAALISWVAILAAVPRDMRPKLLVVFLALSMLGATCGVLGGLSRELAVGSIIAAALGFLGGVVVYLFAADNSKGVIVSVCTVCFSMALFFSYFAGSSLRFKPEAYAFWREACVAKLTDKDVMNDKLIATVVDRSFGGICAQIFNTERQVLAPN